MTLEQWAYISEIAAAFAVVASLIYLGIQVRQSNVLSRAQTRQTVMEAAQKELHTLVHDPALFTYWTKDELSLEEKVKLHAWLMASMQTRQYEWFSRQDRVLEATLHDAYKGVIAVVLGTERARRWWRVYGQYSFDPEFAAHVEAILAENPLTTFFSDFDNW